ncbi:MAG TPA: SGNH/GDSL hydrolase family protein [Armatimonadota bacterium]|jgi:lysophospholipase L1-like esterase
MHHSTGQVCADYLQEVCAALQVEWPENRTINIVCHGHSVPAGYFATPHVDSVNAYPHQLFLRVKARYPHAVTNVIVTAIGGEASPAGAARFARDVLSHRPDVLLIDYALNDRGKGLAAAQTAWRHMIESALAQGSKVILLTPTADTAAQLTDPQDPLCQHAEQIRALAREYHVGLVDSLQCFTEFVANGGVLADLMSQSNHPNRAGHALVATEIFRWFAR